jgi:hypothetical protein
MYKKLKLLERHSSYKKPYYNFETHQHGELRYSWPRFRPGDRPGGGAWVPPTGGTGEEGYGGCAMACNGGMLDCYNGGCDTITCICAEAPLYGTIVEDPTGSASILGQGSAQLQVCIEPQKTNETYGEVVVHVLDSRGYQALTRHPLVDCKECCDTFTLSGASSVNPGAEWTGTISPCCEDVERSAVVDCGSVSVSLSPDGCTVTATVGDTACGTFTVTVTQDVDGCDEQEASLGVMINNTGQGGAYEARGAGTWCYDHDYWCGTACDVGIKNICHPGGAYKATQYCYQYRLGGYFDPANQVLNGCADPPDDCWPGEGRTTTSCAAPCDLASACGGGDVTYWTYEVQEWTCSC